MLHTWISLFKWLLFLSNVTNLPVRTSNITLETRSKHNQESQLGEKTINKTYLSRGLFVPQGSFSDKVSNQNITIPTWHNNPNISKTNSHLHIFEKKMQKHSRLN